MLGYIEFLDVPAKAALALVGLFFIIQIIGELLEFKGKVVPEFLKVRKYFVRKKQEREILRQVPDLMKNVQRSLDEFKGYYNEDNINKRNEWMEKVNSRLELNDTWIKELDKKMDKNNEVTLSLLIDSKRNTIINFASYVADETSHVTKEQFNRVFKIHKEYEKIIEENGLTNGEVDIAFRIISESYESHMRNHSFIENVRGYDI